MTTIPPGYLLGTYIAAYESLHRKAVLLAEAIVERGTVTEYPEPDVTYGMAKLVLDSELTTPPEAMRDHVRAMIAEAVKP